MPITPTPKKKDKRRKATTALGRQILQEQRQRLAQEAADLAEKMVREAEAVRDQQRPINMPNKEHVAINRSVVRLTAAVLSTEDVLVPIHCERGEENSHAVAWTDFEQIYVKYKPQDNPRVLAANIRGLLYHEGGHIRFTLLPFLELVKENTNDMGDIVVPHGIGDVRVLHRAWNILEDQRMETAVVSDSPRKAAFLTPMIMTDHVRTVDMMVANWPLLVWRKYLPRRMRDEARKLFIVRHGAAGEHLAHELDRIVTSYVMATTPQDMWTAVCEMHVLLGMCNPIASRMDDAGHNEQRRNPKLREVEDNDDFDGLTIPIDQSMLPTDEEDYSDQSPDLPEPTSLDDLSEAEVEHIMEILAASMLSPETLLSIRYMLMEEGEEESETGKTEEGSPQPHGEEEGDATDDSKPEADDDEGEPQGGHQQHEDEPEEDAGDAQDEAGDHDEVEPPADSGGASGTHTDDGTDVPEAAPLTDEDLDEMLQEAEEERLGQSELDNDMSAYHEALTDNVTDLDVYIGGISDNNEAIAEADTLAYEIEQAFHEHTMDRAPQWVEQQRRGVLNVGRYMNRIPGDSEFFRAWTEDDAPGYNIAVSVLLDYSGSMARHSVRLAQAGYACKLACQNLGIPCTVALWDTEARTLWDARERAEHMPVIHVAGGTVPDMVLADLDNQRMDKEKHLVLIMTDGAWQGRWSSGRGTLAWYKDEGRSIVGFGYQKPGLAANMLARGCDEAFTIDDLMEIPRKLEQFLLDIV